jgi:hypothetical protein
MPTRRLIPLLALLGALLLPATSSAALSKATVERLHMKALAAAKALKEKHPTNLVAVRTTYGKVKSAFGSGPSHPAATKVFLIYMKGRFHSGGKIHTRYNLVLRAGKDLKPLVAYFDEPYPDELGDPTKI